MTVMSGATSALLAGIERVVQDLFAHHQRPILERVPGLILQLTQNSISRETLPKSLTLAKNREKYASAV